jgi:hypothetical protein
MRLCCSVLHFALRKDRLALALLIQRSCSLRSVNDTGAAMVIPIPTRYRWPESIPLNEQVAFDGCVMEKVKRAAWTGNKPLNCTVFCKKIIGLPAR